MSPTRQMFLFRSSVFSLLLPTLLVAGCDGSTCDTPSIIRRVANGAFNEAGTHVVLAEPRYETCDPEEPYFNATKGRNFELILHEVPAADLAALGQNPSQAAYLELIDTAREIIRFPENGIGGGIVYDPIYYFKDGSRILCESQEGVVLLDTASGEMQVLRAPAERLAELVDTPARPGLSQALSVRQFAPAPNGEIVALFQSAAYEGENIFQLYHRHLVSFFDAETGAHQGSYRVDIDGQVDSEIDPRLKPPLSGLFYGTYFIWQKDSQGVYVITRERSIAMDLQGAISTVDMVPEEPVPAPGGRVADDGRFLVPYPPEDSNDTRMVIELVQGWVPFVEIPTIPAGTEDYSFSFSDTASASHAVLGELPVEPS